MYWGSLGTLHIVEISKASITLHETSLTHDFIKVYLLTIYRVFKCFRLYLMWIV